MDSTTARERHDTDRYGIPSGFAHRNQPCPLATNIAAVGFIGKDIDDKHRVFCNGLLYTAGRILTYAGIGLAFIPLLREGANTYALQKSSANTAMRSSLRHLF